jgi:hypothetical protein
MTIPDRGIEMSVHLQRIRVTHTTSRQSDAGTDDRVDLRLFIDPHPWTTYPFKGWRSLELDSSRDDRQRGATESYELDLTEGSLGISVSGTTVPRGIAFSGFARVRCAAWFLTINGSDWWQALSYRFEGLFKEMRFIPGTIDAYEVVDLGWLVMSERSSPLDMSTDSSEGVGWHHIIIDGPLPA